MNTIFATRAKINTQENYTYQLRGADGKVKKLFRSNWLGTVLMRAFRKIETQPFDIARDANGFIIGNSVKNTWLARMSAYGPRNFLTGSWVNELHRSNLVTSAGKAGVASRINGSGGEAAFTYLAIGIGATAANIADTTLGSEITTNGGQRASATASRTTTTVTNDTARLVLTYTFTGSFAVTEAGAFNASSAGTLLNRQVFTAVNVVSGDTLQVTVNISNA